MAAMPEQSIKRTIRRGELRQIVPLADSTIYEMEQRGEFPRRFALPMRGLGSQRSGSVAGRAPTGHGERLDAARASPGRPQAPKPPRQSAGSGTSIGIVGGMRTGRCFRPATQASMISAHSCIMCRR